MTQSIEDIIRIVVREVLRDELASLRELIVQQKAPVPVTRDFLSSAEVADLAGCHPVSVRRALEGGELHGTQPQVGARWRVGRECALAWAERRPCPHEAL